MRIIRYADPKGNIRFASETPNGQRMELEGDLFGSPRPTARPAQVAKLLAPLTPTNIFCIGLNYRRHAAESGKPEPKWPVLFIKSTGAVQNPGDPIELPTHLPSDSVDFECELAVVIGKKCKNVAKSDALKYVLGYTAANDVSARDWQNVKGGTQWCRAKTFDTFCPLGPAIVTTDDIPDPNSLKIKTVINGETLQDWSTSDMIFNVPALIEFLSGSTTLLPGSVILTGTPHGVGFARTPPRWLAPGDTVNIEIEKIGALSNPVILEK